MANENPQQVVLSLQLVQAIGEYLVQRPYREVAPLLSSLQTEVNTGAQPNGPAPIDLAETQGTPQ